MFDIAFKKWLPFVKYLFAIGVIYWLWKSEAIDFSVIPKVFHPIYGPTILGLSVVAVLAFSARLHNILRVQKMDVSFSRVWRLSLMGLFFNYTLPGGTGGDLIKVYYLVRGKDQKAVAIGSVLFDRVVGVFGMMLMAFVALLLRPSELIVQNDLKWILAVLVAGLLGVSCFGLVAKVYSKNEASSSGPMSYLLRFKVLDQLFGVLKEFFGKGLFWPTLGWTFVTQFSAVFIMYVAALAMGYAEADLLAFFIVAPLGFITMAIPISPAGIGVGQAAFLALFKIYTGEATDMGPTVITVYQVVMFVVALLGFYYYMAEGRAKRHGHTYDPNPRI